MAFGKGKAKENGENSSKTNKGVLIILFILGLVVLGGAAFGGVYLFMKTKSTVESQEVIIENTYMELKEFTVNLGDEGGKRFFKGEISIGYDKSKEKLAEELKGKEVVIRDDIIFYFRSQKADYINNIENAENMKKQLIDAINKDLTKGKITDIRFKSMIIQ
ncbi:flagellar basal body-associated protein FliL [Clostridium puniceum]|uniref:Flagellar protein FliL n=1 Tax=Clostridium puniceum TaxID=29367 RepID=A0A1S8TBJ2_9CLOT|nr:flagellar basal body-associated FliL family protein [Clostridium puniceum]OOM75032.1 flagellar basal body-associated protein FliL [Clostridium puniceum]